MLSCTIEPLHTQYNENGNLRSNGPELCLIVINPSTIQHAGDCKMWENEEVLDQLKSRLKKLKKKVDDLTESVEKLEHDLVDHSHSKEEYDLPDLHDIIEDILEERERLSRVPGGLTCGNCGRKGLSQTAVSCPDCGVSLLPQRTSTHKAPETKQTSLEEHN